MKISDLMAELEELREEHGDDLEVQLYQQPSYPMAYGIDEVTFVEKNGKAVVFLTEGTQVGYAPRLGG